MLHQGAFLAPFSLDAFEMDMVQYLYNNASSSGLNGDHELLDFSLVTSCRRPSRGSIVVAMLQFLLGLLHLFLRRECRKPILDLVNRRLQKTKQSLRWWLVGDRRVSPANS